MSQPTIQSNQVPAQPRLKDAFDLLKKDILLSLNAHALATIQTVDFTAQTVTATINYTKTVFVQNAQGENVSTNVAYPTLVDVPFISIAGGNAYLAIPPTAGDQAIIFFNDRDIDNWFLGSRPGPVGPVASGRLHSLADGIALVGLNKITSYDSTRAVLRKGNAMVGLTSELVKISNEITTLKTLLDNLITAIKGITVSPGTFTAGATPVTGSGVVSSGSQTTLDGITTQIGTLLE